MKLLLASLVAYLIGSVPFGLIFSKSKKVDPRLYGSGNIGTTNVLRTAGKVPAILTLLFDILKGSVAVFIARGLLIEPAWIVGLCAILGHIFPVYLKFRGGKGVATTIGVMIALSPSLGLFTICLWLLIAFITRYSSLAALISIGLSPIVFIVLKKNDMIWFTMAVALIIVIKHKDNIKKILSGTEKKIGERSLSLLLFCFLLSGIFLITPQRILAQFEKNQELAQKIKILQDEALDKGLKFPEFVSFYIIKNQKLSAEDLQQLIELDRSNPQNYFILSELYFKKDIKAGILKGLPNILKGYAVAVKDILWLVNLMLLYSTIIILSLIFASGFAGIIRLPLEIPLLLHEVQETKLAYSLFVVLILSAIAGLPYFATAILVISAIHLGSRPAKICLMVWSLFLISLPFLYQIEQKFINILSNPDIRAIRDVNASKDNHLILAKKMQDWSQSEIVLISKALALKREGRVDEAIEILKNLSKTTTDYRVFNNLGNCLFIKGDMEEAIRYYQKAIQVKNNPQSLYNLSQVFREKLDFEKARQYYEEAIRLNGDLVSQFTKISSKTPNRFLMDITLDTKELLRFSISVVGGTSNTDGASNTGGTSNTGSASNSGSASNTGGASNSGKNLRSIKPLEILLPLILFSLLVFPLRVKAYRCSRCGKIICNFCQKKELWEKICPECYEVLITLDKTDSKTRLQRLLYLQKRKTCYKRIFYLLSVVPGLPQIAQGWIITGFIILSLVNVTAALYLAGQFYLIETFIQSHLKLIGIFTGAMALLIHLFTLRRLSRTWA